MHDQTPIAGRLDGLRVVVTGGARGIGAAIAERMSAEGARMAILDRLADRGAELAGRLGGVFVPVDLTDAASTTAALDEALAGLGGVDVLVNNAGILRFSSLLEMSLDDWDDTFAINVRPMLITTQVCGRWMVQNGGGSIINLASMAGKAGGAGQGHYAASKAAVIALTRVTALELGEHGVRANCICPGFVLTEMGADTRTAEDIALWSLDSPLGRLGEPEDVAAMASFLASADAAYLTGQAFNVTGGMIMH